MQYCQNLQTKAWGYWRNVPMLSAGSWNAEYYMGASNGRLFQYTGATDGGTLAGATGTPIAFSILTSFQPHGNHGHYKQVGHIRVIGVTAGDTTYNLKAIYDYDIFGEAGAPVAPDTQCGSLWDTALWDAAIWDSQLTGASQIQGGQNTGRTVAIAMRGESSSRATTVGWDITVVEGGYL